MKRCWAAGVHLTWEHSEHAVFRPTLFLSVSFCHWLIYVRSSPSIQRRCFSRLSSRQRGRIKDSFITALSPHWQPNCSEGEILTFSVHCPCGRNPTTEHWTQQHRLLFFFFFPIEIRLVFSFLCFCVFFPLGRCLGFFTDDWFVMSPWEKKKMSAFERLHVLLRVHWGRKEGLFHKWTTQDKDFDIIIIKREHRHMVREGKSGINNLTESLWVSRNMWKMLIL